MHRIFSLIVCPFLATTTRPLTIFTHTHAYIYLYIHTQVLAMEMLRKRYSKNHGYFLSPNKFATVSTDMRVVLLFFFITLQETRTCPLRH